MCHYGISKVPGLGVMNHRTPVLLNAHAAQQYLVSAISLEAELIHEIKETTQCVCLDRITSAPDLNGR